MTLTGRLGAGSLRKRVLFGLGRILARTLHYSGKSIVVPGTELTLGRKQDVRCS